MPSERVISRALQHCLNRNFRTDEGMFPDGYYDNHDLAQGSSILAIFEDMEKANRNPDTHKLHPSFAKTASIVEKLLNNIVLRNGAL